MSKSWSRFKQSTRETFKTSKEDLTEIPSDITTLLSKAEAVAKLYTELIAKTSGFFPELKLKLKNADDPTKAQSLYALGQSFEMLSSEYTPAHPSSGDFFERTFGTMTKLAQRKAALDAVYAEHFLEPKLLLIEDRIYAAKDHYEKLKTRRLDLDAKKHKLKMELKTDADAGKIKKYEIEVQSAQERFDDEASAIRQLLHPVVNDHEMASSQTRQSAVLLNAMKSYFMDSYRLLEELDHRTNFDQWERGVTSSPQTMPASVRPGGTFLKPIESAQQTPQRVMMPAMSKNNAPAAIQLNRTTSADGPRQLLATVASASAVPVVGHKPVVQKPPSPPVLMPKPSLQQKCRAIYAFTPQQTGDLCMEQGDIIVVLDRTRGDWWTGRNLRTREEGDFPSNYVELM